MVTRSEDEFKAGHPAGAINIPYMFKVGSGNYIGTSFYPLYHFKKIAKKSEESTKSKKKKTLVLRSNFDTILKGYDFLTITCWCMIIFLAGMSKNPKFLEQVSTVFSQDREIIVVCLSDHFSSYRLSFLNFYSDFVKPIPLLIYRDAKVGKGHLWLQLNSILQ